MPGCCRLPADQEQKFEPATAGLRSLTVVPALMAISFPLKTVSDLWHSLKTASSIGLLLWIVVASVVLLVRSGPRAEPRTAQLQSAVSPADGRGRQTPVG